MKHFILSLLQMKEDNIDFTNTSVKEIKHKGIKSLFITAKLTYDPTHCPACGCINADFSIVKNGTRTSRITLPHLSGLPAFLKLAKQRYLCKHCQHSFTAETPINDWLGSLSSTTETIENMGMAPGAKLIKTQVLTLPVYLQKITGIKEAVHIKRVRYADNIPIGVENNYYPVELGEKIKQYDLNKVSLYDLLEQELGIMSIEAEQTIKSGQVKKDDSKLLKVSPTTSMLIAERKLMDLNGHFVEYERAAYRADMYSFNIKLFRKK